MVSWGPSSGLSEAPREFSGFCPIPPRPKGRPRFDRSGHAYTDKATREYESSTRAWLMDAYGTHVMPMDGVLRLDVEFVIPRPQRAASPAHWFSATRPDTDNYVKAFSDAMDFKGRTSDGVAMGVVRDDSRVAAVIAVKRFAEPGERCGVRFSVTHLDARLVVVMDGVPEAKLSVLDPAIRRVTEEWLLSLRGPLRGVEEAIVACGSRADASEGRRAAIAAKLPDARRLLVL